MAKFKKLERDGKVAVLYSPGYGAGWYTWNRDHLGLLYDSQLVEAVLGHNCAAAVAIASDKYPDIYTGGGNTLQVEWVPKGCRFEVTEYDGSESVRILGPDDGLVA